MLEIFHPPPLWVSYDENEFSSGEKTVEGFIFKISLPPSIPKKVGSLSPIPPEFKGFFFLMYEWDWH